MYKIAEYLYDTFSESNREASRRFCSCQMFRSLRVMCKRSKKASGDTAVANTEVKKTEENKELDISG